MVTSFLKAEDINAAYKYLDKLEEMCEQSSKNGSAIQYEYTIHVGKKNIVLEIKYSTK